jgi:hypothetical protein
VALSATIQLDLGTTLLLSGLFNIASGAAFRIPMCVQVRVMRACGPPRAHHSQQLAGSRQRQCRMRVLRHTATNPHTQQTHARTHTTQPMKAIAAVALAPPGLSLPEAMAAGLVVGAAVLLLGGAGLMDRAARTIPGCIVRGIQLAVGLQLAQKVGVLWRGVLLRRVGAWSGVALCSAMFGKAVRVCAAVCVFGTQGMRQALLTAEGAWRGLWGVEGLLVGLLAAAFLLATTTPPAAAPAGAADGSGSDGSSGSGSSAGVDSGAQSGQQPSHSAGGDEEQQQLLPVQPGHRRCGDAPPGCSGTCAAGSSSGRVPSALLVVLAGLVMAVAAQPSVLAGLRLGPSAPRLYWPSWPLLKAGALKAGLAQLPLTALNSVVAVSQLASQLFPERAAADGWRWRPGAIALGVGGMNCVGCLLGAFPCCTGSGGLAAQVGVRLCLSGVWEVCCRGLLAWAPDALLAPPPCRHTRAQYKFGARSGLAPVLLGAAKVGLGLAFGSSLLALLQHFPAPLLGAMLAVAGLELAAAARSEAAQQRGFGFMLLTAAAILALGNTALGVLLGLGGCAVVAACELVTDWRRRRRARLAGGQQKLEHV